MHYQLGISATAKRALRLLPKQDRQEIGYKLFLMQDDLAGDVKKLQGSQNEYRLRVGNYRVMFRLERDIIAVYKVGDRKDVYR
jgi:mRNA interferase RelE/StbE